MPTTKITKGKSFARAVKYDLEQGNNRQDQAKIKRLPATRDEAAVKGYAPGQRARLLAANVNGETVAEIAAEFEKVAAQRPGIKEPVHKVSISLKPGEHLETRQWLEVGKSYLKEMGYKDAPFLIAQHREKDHEHIHIVASRVDFNGRVVSDAFEKKKARTWAREVEERYDLSRTPEKAEEKGLSRVEIEQAVRTEKTPPKLILQQSIRQTLAAHPDTSDFIQALEQQNILMRVKTKEKEIVGVSFGINGRGFKGGSLGSKFTWAGLQKEGLKYEFERDYERLEAASRRRSGAESESAGSKLDGRFGNREFNDGSFDDRRERNARPVKSFIEPGGAIYHADSDRAAEPARRGGAASGRGTAVTELGTGIGDQSESATAQSIPVAAAATERIAETGNGAAESGHQSELRRTRRFDSGETATARRVESGNSETIAAEESDQTTAAESEWQRQLKRQIEQHETAEAEFTERRERERRLELLHRLSGGELFTDPTVESIGTGLLPAASAPHTLELSGTGAGGIENPALAGMGGQHLPTPAADALADLPAIQGVVGGSQIHRFSDDGDAGSDLSRLRADRVSNGSNSRLFGNHVSDGGTAESVSSQSVNLSARLRSALDYAELTARQTLDHGEALQAAEAEEIEVDEQEIELEEVISRGMSM